jgi:hypothetical protein
MVDARLDDGKTGKTTVWHPMEQTMGNTFRRSTDIFEYCINLSAIAHNAGGESAIGSQQV